MPLYEYTCRGCGKLFEVLMREGITPVCPSFRGEDVEKVFSAFAVGAQSAKSSAMPQAGPCASCPSAGGPGCGAFGN
jgi:putative FmdB family regulatory protein